MKHSVNMPYTPKRDESKTPIAKQGIKKYILFGFLAMIVLGVLVYATTIISNTGINTPSINNITYVSSVSQIQSSLIAGKEVHIIAGDYPLTNTINLTSNLTIVIDEGARLYYANGAIPTILTDSLGDNKSYMFYGNNLQNLNIYNYGKISPELIYNPPQIDQISFINDSNNVIIYGGEISHVFGGWAIFNSNKIEISNIYSPNSNPVRGELTGHECNNEVYVHDIRGKAQEAVDMNAFNRNVLISNILIEQYNKSDDEVLDINGGENIVINNVIGINFKQAGTFSSGTARFGTCATSQGHNITAYNLVCFNCTSDPYINPAVGDVIINYFGNGQQKYISTMTTKAFHVDQKGNSTAFYVNMDAKQLTGEYGAWFYSNVAQTNAELVKITQDNSASSKQALVINNDGTGNGITVDQNGAGFGIELDSTGSTKSPLRYKANTTAVVCDTNSAGGTYYDGTTNKHYGCNGTIWNALY